LRSGFLGARGGVVTPGFLKRVLSAVLVPERVTLFALGVGGQNTFDGADAAGGSRSVVRATDAGQGAARLAHGLDKSPRMGFRSLGGAVGGNPLFEALRVSPVTEMTGLVDHRRNLGWGDRGLRYLHGRNYTDKRL
jgi:hypothetical protein